MADKMTAEKIVKTMRYCCDDIKHNEECNLEKCYQVGLLETRDGDSRFCRQWLIHDAADLIENQAKEIESLKAENELLQKAYDSLEPTFIQMGHENENYKCHIENLTSENSTLQSKIKELEEIPYAKVIKQLKHDIWVLEQKLQRNENKALTLEEIKSMEGKPVWIEHFDSSCSCKRPGEWLILKVCNPTALYPYADFKGESLCILYYYRGWLAYRNELESEDKQ